MSAAGARTRQRDNDAPPPEPEDMENEGRERVLDDGELGGVEVDLDKLPPERDAKKGGEERKGAIEEVALEQDEDREDIRRRRRVERVQRKESREREEGRLRAELDATKERLARIEAERENGRVEGAKAEVERIESEMATLQRQYAEAKTLKEKAFKDNDAKSIVEADEALASARERYGELGTHRDRIILQARREAQQPRVSQELRDSAKSFVTDHPWYDRGGADRDSAKVLALDRKMSAEGWDPNSKGYWEELRERVREELPHRFEEERDRDERRPQRGSPTGGSTRESGATGGKNTFYLSPKRVAALKEAGMWDDAEKRARMIRRYKERDELDRREQRR